MEIPFLRRNVEKRYLRVFASHYIAVACDFNTDVRDVSHTAIRIVCQGLDLLFAFPKDRSSLRFHLERHQSGSSILVVGSTLADPLAKQSIAFRGCLKSNAATVRHLPGGFHEQQALVGSPREQPATTRLLHQMLVVFARLESQQRQLKAILPVARLGMTNADIAAGLRQHRHHIVDKTDGGRFSSVAALWHGHQTQHYERRKDETSQCITSSELIGGRDHFDSAWRVRWQFVAGALACLGPEPHQRINQF